MRIGFLQYDPHYLHVDKNLDLVERLIASADADLLVLPELFASGYLFQKREDVEAVAEPVPGGKTTERLLRWSAQTGTTFVAGLPERADESCYNSAVVVSPQGFVGTYRKVHLYYQEKLWFKSGDLGFRCFDLTDRAGQAYRLGVMVCFDWYFPESARSLAVQGADLIAHPSNLVRKSCPSAMPVRALENHLFTVTANRIGMESSGGETLAFIGQSLICGPSGDVLVSAGRDETRLGIVEVDVAEARNRQITEHNHLLNDRRPEFYRLT